jgi:dienelactone hydrolase/predicted Ser/Thr protein kinase
MIGQSISHYRILKKLGEGGMGVVYLAEDTRLQRRVAVKFLHESTLGGPEQQSRFRDEARAAAALNHPSICTIHEIDEDKGRAFIVMEYVEGRTLASLIAEGPLDLERAVGIATQVAEGLDAAHARGIIHRDVKPANIMITTEGRAKIMDFGLAVAAERTRMTRAGTLLGTVTYMSPEQARGENVDHRTDIWSLGIVLHEMLTGKPPFKGDHEQAVIYSIRNEDPPSLRSANPGVPPEIERIVARALKRDPEQRYRSAAEMLCELEHWLDEAHTGAVGRRGPVSLRALLRPRLVVPALVLLAGLVLAGSWWLERRERIRWAEQEALPRIAQLVEEGSPHYREASLLALEAEKVIPQHPELLQLLERTTVSIDITSEPPGASVHFKPYDELGADWQPIGTTPLEDIRLPKAYYRWKLEKDGYRTLVAAVPTVAVDISQQMLARARDLHWALDAEGSIPPGMVRVTGGETGAGPLGDFLIDRYEVTNGQYQDFVNAGGYRDQRYWKHEFIHDGKVLSWDEAMAEFVDRTGRNGPAAWEAGDYPDGRRDHPVTGISWYEAAAYAEFASKSLPTGQHWGLARGSGTFYRTFHFPTLLVRQSNLGGEGLASVGTYPGVTAFGAYDMAGNAREWCWNQTPQGRLVRGGAWDDNAYMFANWSQADPFDRSERNGFRCALYLDPDAIPPAAFEPVQAGETPDLRTLEPVSDEVFQAYLAQFSYDWTPLNVEIESRDESAEDWIHEKVTFDGVHGEERIPVHIFLPTRSSPPHQAVLYFPGSTSVYRKSSEDLEQYIEFVYYLRNIVKDGRAVIYPVYKGTFERQDARLTPIHHSAPTRLFTEYMIDLAQEFQRCVDYLESRPDMDGDRIAYLGMSWGGVLAPVILAVEGRIETAVLAIGGAEADALPEVNAVNYLPRVKTPVLMLNGRYDMNIVYETMVQPMYELLGTPPEHKKLVLYDTDHYLPKVEAAREILAWLDRYLGPVGGGGGEDPGASR